MSADLDKVTILLVDDRPERLLTYQAILEELDQHLLCANSGRHALELLLSHEVSVILLDVRMPDMDGFETASLIREHHRYRTVPIIFVSGVADVALEQARGYRLGAIDFVTVPIVPDILRSKVAILVELCRQRRALQRMNDALSEANATQGAAYARELERMNRELQQADERKDEFLAILAHELRNPLAAIRNAVAVMAACPIDDQRLQDCRGILDRQSAQLVRLADDLLDVSRIKQGLVKLDLAPHNVRWIVEQAVEMTRAMIGERDHTLCVECPDDVTIEVDFSRLVQVLGNLLSNAAKYTNHGGVVRLCVTTEEDWIHFRVSDTGIGISPESLPSIFSLFSRAHDSSTYSPSGLGVGLALVRQVAELHGGEVRASSAGVDQGSEFSVRVPRRAAHGMRSPRVATEGSLETGTPYRILIADDNHDALESLAILVELEGHDVRQASNGTQALAEIRDWRPQVAILDLGMPGMTGYEVARAARNELCGRETVIIALSGWSQEHDRAKASAAGFDAHLVKPVAAQDLLRVISEQFDLRQGQRHSV